MDVFFLVFFKNDVLLKSLIDWYVVCQPVDCGKFNKQTKNCTPGSIPPSDEKPQSPQFGCTDPQHGGMNDSESHRFHTSYFHVFISLQAPGTSAYIKNHSVSVAMKPKDDKVKP